MTVRSSGSDVRRRDLWRRAGRLPRDPALVILVITGCVHLLRGAPVDAVIFLAVALGLIVAELAYRDEPVEPPPEPRTPSRVGWIEAGAVVVGAALFGVLVGSWSRYSMPVMWVIVAVGVVTVGSVWHQPPGLAVDRPPEPAPFGWGALAWVALALTWCGWELVSFVHEVNVDDVSIGHPTLSDIVEPVLDNAVARWVVLAAWLAAGYGLVRTGRRVVSR